jgi:hypothetical protein
LWNRRTIAAKKYDGSALTGIAVHDNRFAGSIAAHVAVIFDSHRVGPRGTTVDRLISVVYELVVRPASDVKGVASIRYADTLCDCAKRLANGSRV